MIVILYKSNLSSFITTLILDVDSQWPSSPSALSRPTRHGSWKWLLNEQWVVFPTNQVWRQMLIRGNARWKSLHKFPIRIGDQELAFVCMLKRGTAVLHDSLFNMAFPPRPTLFSLVFLFFRHLAPVWYYTAVQHLLMLDTRSAVAYTYLKPWDIVGAYIKLKKVISLLHSIIKLETNKQNHPESLLASAAASMCYLQLNQSFPSWVRPANTLTPQFMRPTAQWLTMQWVQPAIWMDCGNP